MKKWIIWAVIFYIHSAVLLYKGIDKIEGYYMASEYSELNKHVYVGETHITTLLTRIYLQCSLYLAQNSLSRGLF